MDADVYLVDRFDSFLNNRVTLFQEYHPSYGVESQIDADGNRIVDCVSGCGIQAAFMISEKGNPYIKMLLENYSDRRFVLNSEGKVDDNELISPSIYAIASEAYGYKYKDVTQQLSLGGTVIYPSKFVAGGLGEVAVEAFAIHQCEHSWYDFSKFQLMKRSIKRYIKKTVIIDSRNSFRGSKNNS